MRVESTHPHYSGYKGTVSRIYEHLNLVSIDMDKGFNVILHKSQVKELA